MDGIFSKAWASLVFLIMLAFAIRVTWWALEPILPLLLVTALLIIIYRLIFRRKW